MNETNERTEKTQEAPRMAGDREALFSSVPVPKAIAALAVPTVISQLITVVYNMADTFFVGQLGDPNQVAAATISMPLFMFLTAIANLFGIGGASLISRCLGRGDRKKASACASFCIWSVAAVALAYGVLVALLEPVILPVLGANEGTWSYASSYIFYTVGLGSTATVLNPALAHLVRAEGYSRQASFGVAFGGLLNIALDPLFIFGLKMDIAGAAVATLLSNVAALAYFCCFLYKIRKRSTITASFRCFTLKEGIPAEVAAVGLPSFLISTLATVSNTVLNNIISSYANEAVAGMGIAKRIDLLAFAIAQGMTQGALPLIGYNFTSGNKARMMAAIRGLFFGCLFVSLTGTALLFFGAKPITACFIDNAQTVSYGCMFLRIICLACTTTSLNFFAITVFQATGKRLEPIFLSLLRKGTLDVAMMFLFNRLMGVGGVAWATPAADAAALLLSAALLLLPYLKKLKKEQALAA